MSDEHDPEKKIVHLSVAKAEKVKKRPKKEPAGERPFYGPARPLEQLPADSPVIALGCKGNRRYFLDVLGQLIELKTSELGRLPIIGLFGGEDWLRKTFPAYNKDGELKGFNHGLMAHVLLRACKEKGVWDPQANVREQGGWIEETGPDTGELILHCGDVLYVGRERCGTGLRGRILYPKCIPTKEPIFGAEPGEDGPCGTLLAFLKTCSWRRPTIDPLLFVGLWGSQRLGQAAEWRAQGWFTGGWGTGKSTAQTLLRWMHGPNGMIEAENATSAGVAQTIGYSSRPVSLDELESQADNRAVLENVTLMRIASSGGTRLRGGSDGAPSATQLRNCFIASSVFIPSLRGQDRSRIAVLSLDKRASGGKAREPGEDEDEDELDPFIDQHRVLGKREAWEKIGAQLSGRLLLQWFRYKKTFRAFRRALTDQGHSDRAADQYGAIGAAYDLLMFDGFDSVRASDWALLLADVVAEASDQKGEERQCLDHLLEYMPDVFRQGARDSIAQWLVHAKLELSEERNGEARNTLAKLGIRLYREAGNYDERARRFVGKEIFFVDISHTAAPLREIFHKTQWGGEPGADGTYVQALQRLPGALYGTRLDQRRHRINGVQHTVTTLPWDTVFPPLDAIEEANIAPPDRQKDH